MRMIYFTKWAVAVLLLLPPFCIAQEQRNLIDKSRIPVEADDVQKFAPAGWKIEEQVTGDLNGDSLPDYALKLVEDKPAKDSQDIATERQRALVIVLQSRAANFLGPRLLTNYFSAPTVAALSTASQNRRPTCRSRKAHS